MKEILVTGNSGLVGSRFAEISRHKNRLLLPSETELDITDKDCVGNYFRESMPQAVVNFAAYTDVSAGENQRGDETGLCYRLNVEAVRSLLAACGENAYFVQIGTDMVFPGNATDPGPYAEDHPVNAIEKNLTWYGYTKALAEKMVLQKPGGRGATLRLIYPVRAEYTAKLDYLRKPLRLYDEGKLYPLFSDQQVSLALIDEICLTLDQMIDREPGGIFHASSADTGTPYEIVSYLLEKTRGVKDAVEPASLAEFLKTVVNPTRYPMYGGLQVSQTEKLLGIKFSPWREVVNQLADVLARQG